MERKPSAVHVHAFAETDEGQTYCEATDPALSGWSVWVRMQSPTDPDDFDVGIEEDHPTDEAAMARAQELSDRFGVPIDDY